MVLTVPGFAHLPRRVPGATSPLFTERFIAEKSFFGFTAVGEYLPLECPVEEIRNEILRRPAGGEGVEVRSWVRYGQGGFRLIVTAAAPSQVKVPLIRYPFWQARHADGSPARLREEGCYLEVETGPGESRIVFSRHYTWPWFAGWSLSAVSLAGLVYLGRRSPGRSVLR